MRLVGARAAFGLPLADRLELPLVPAGAGAEDEPLAGERLQGRELLREDDRVAGRHDEDRGSEADTAGRRRRVRQRDDRVEPRDVVEAVPVQEMVGRPERVEAELLGVLRERGDLLAAAPVRADEGREEDPDPKAGRGGRHQRRPASFSARSTQVLLRGVERQERRADVRLVDHSQPDERVLHARAVVADRRGEDRVAQRLEHVAERVGALEVSRARGLVHLHLFPSGERPESEERAFGPEQVGLEEEVVVAVQDGRRRWERLHEPRGLHEALRVERGLLDRDHARRRPSRG